MCQEQGASLVIGNRGITNKVIQMEPWQRNGMIVFSGSLRVRSESMLFHSILCFGLGKVVYTEACVRCGPTQQFFSRLVALGLIIRERWNIEIFAIDRKEAHTFVKREISWR